MKAINQKRGIFFTVDAIIATSIIIITIILSASYYIYETKSGRIDFMANDLTRSFTSLKVGEVENAYVSKLINDKNITRLNNTILEQIGEFWAENDIVKAKKLAENVTYSLIPDSFGIGIWVNDELIFKRNKSVTKSLTSSRKIISGIAKEKPRYGISSRAFLKSIDSKNTYAYAYFGGFVGQGNITVFLEEIPSDAIINSAFIEVDSGDDFDVLVNNNFCKSLVSSKNRNMSSERWNISSCKNLFNAGIKNKISLKFGGLLNESYIAGGYVKVGYNTKVLFENKTEGIGYYYFPAIKGLINLYSSFDIPGTLNSMDLFVRFYNNKTTYLNIGNETIFRSGGSSIDQIINISGITLALEPKTIPLRMGVGNISESINITSGEPSDSVLVTDVSGSMNDCGEYGQTQVCSYECRTCFWIWCWWNTIQCVYSGSCSGDECGSCSSGVTQNHQVLNQNTCIKTKMELAKEADSEFVDTVLNLTGNSVGLVSYHSSVSSTESLTDVKINLQNEINSYSANGGTCICCGINRAKDMLISSTNKRFMVVMSDGQENYYCNNFNDYTGSSSDTYDAIAAGQNACNQGITVFAVGFGSDADENTLKQVACNESLYFNATNASDISKVYQQIGEAILVIANYSSQIVSVSGDYKGSELYSDSYLRFNYTPVVSPPTFGEIEIVIETDKFDSCNPTINVPNNTRVTQAKALSYSGEHWTRDLKVNSNTIFNITKYGSDYRDLGDPFSLQIPANYLNNGNNNLEIYTADGPGNNTGCSKNNSMVYKVLIKSAIDYGEPLTNASGCNWEIEQEDGSITQLKAPPDYSGSEKCYFNSTDVLYNNNDAYHYAVYKILTQLDFNNNQKPDIDFAENDLVIDYVVIRDVPSLWGPAIVEIRIWE